MFLGWYASKCNPLASFGNSTTSSPSIWALSNQNVVGIFHMEKQWAMLHWKTWMVYMIFEFHISQIARHPIQQPQNWTLVQLIGNLLEDQDACRDTNVKCFQIPAVTYFHIIVLLSRLINMINVCFLYSLCFFGWHFPTSSINMRTQDRHVYFSCPFSSLTLYFVIFFPFCSLPPLVCFTISLHYVLHSFVLFNGAPHEKFWQ